MDAVSVIDDLLGGQSATNVVATGGDSAVVVASAGTVVEVPKDPSDGIAVDLAGSGADLVFTPPDPALEDFGRDGALAAAEGDGYSTVAQPLLGGDFRLAVTLDDPTAPRSLTYDLDLPEGTRVAPRPDGGFDFLAADGSLTGGLAAPWGVDAAGVPVEVVYHYSGDGRITRHVLTTSDTAFPVVANFCIFGKNKNGGCRGKTVAAKAAIGASFGFFGVAVCLPAGPVGAAVCGPAFGAFSGALPGPA